MKYSISHAHSPNGDVKTILKRALVIDLFSKSKVMFLIYLFYEQCSSAILTKAKVSDSLA